MANISLQYIVSEVRTFCVHIGRYLQYRQIYHPNISSNMVYFLIEVFNFNIDLIFISKTILTNKEKLKFFYHCLNQPDI